MFRDDEKEFRLRPRKPPRPATRNDATAWAIAFKTVMHHARSSRRAAPKRASVSRSSIPRKQRCAVRVTYTRNTVRGQWRAHGRYIERESAAGGEGGVGFDHAVDGIETAARLAAWQAARDERLWKVIVSPEFGDRVDLSRLTRDLMRCMEEELATELEWAAVEHHNTEHPHVHVALRGRRDNGEALQLPRQYIQNRIREIASDLCTRQLGYRTERDAQEAERREIAETRVTSLDRRLVAQQIRRDDAAAHFDVVRNPVQTGLSARARIRTQHEAARLAVLQRMGLAESTGPNTWRVRGDFEQILKAMRTMTDRQRTLAAHGALLSDERLPIEVLNPNLMTTVEGRVLVHGQDEHSGRNYLMLEGTDAKVYFVHYTPDMEEARSRGQLRTNSFVRLRKLSAVGTLIDVIDLGDAERLLKNPVYFGEAARECIRRGVAPTEEGWGGWLARYQAELCKAVRDTLQRREREVTRAHER